MPQPRRLLALLLVLGCGGEVGARGGNASAPGVDGDGATAPSDAGGSPPSPRGSDGASPRSPGGSGEREPELCPSVIRVAQGLGHHPRVRVGQSAAGVEVTRGPNPKIELLVRRSEWTSRRDGAAASASACSRRRHPRQRVRPRLAQERLSLHHEEARDRDVTRFAELGSHHHGAELRLVLHRAGLRLTRNVIAATCVETAAGKPDASFPYPAADDCPRRPAPGSPARGVHVRGARRDARHTGR